MDKPRVARITRIRRLTPHHNEYTLDAEADALPGQFCMLWLPGVNEKPMSFSNVKGRIQVTVKLAGPFTAKLFGLAKGDRIGFRGPYGRGFKPVKGKVCLVGGGCGTAPLRPLKDVTKGDAIISARTADELLYENDFKKAGFSVHVATDDGSKGEKAYASQVLERLLEKNDYACVYACGPEIMLKKVYDACLRRGITCQLSLERYMKCGIGICGSCTISGMRVCKDGPVFSAKDLKGTEFGSYTRDASGSRRGMDGC